MTIIQPAQITEPGREILRAAGAFLSAVLQQYPGAAVLMADGVHLQVVTKKGILLSISGTNQATSGIMLPAGSLPPRTRGI